MMMCVTCLFCKAETHLGQGANVCCVCVCVCFNSASERERERESKKDKESEIASFHAENIRPVVSGPVKGLSAFLPLGPLFGWQIIASVI